MAAFTTFFVNAVASTNQQRATQAAAQIANSGVDTLRSLPASDVLTGRDASSVSTQFSSASSTVAPWLAAMTAASDPTAPSGGANAAVPTVGVVQTINKIDYAVNTYLGTCLIPIGSTTDASCLKSNPTGLAYLRAVVAVTWSGAHCPPTKCTYVTATLLNAVDDPLFNLNAQPPAAPAITYPVNNQTQITSEVGDSVNLQPVYTASPPVNWTLTSGTLPAGLNLVAATGQIIGTPTATVTNTPLTLTLSDFFGRTTTVNFTWTVLAGLLISQPPNQASVVGTAITPLTVTATGGSMPYTWTDPNNTLPRGLSLSAGGTVTGTPTAVGMSTVVLTVTDATTKPTHSRTTTFTWTVTYPPFAATNPGAQTSTVGTPDTVTLSTTGGSGSFAWTGGASLPAGFTLTSAGVISGSPTTAGTTSATLTATDTVTGEVQNVAFNWTVFAKPTVSSPGPTLTTTLGATVGFPLGTTCPNAPCTYTLNNGPGTISISSSGVVSGTITGTAKTYTNVTFTVTDSAGATGVTTPFTVVVNPAPTIADPGNQTALEGTADSLAASVSGGTGPYTYSAANLPAWLSINPNTGLISGTAPATTQNATGITVTVRDSSGISATTAAFSWLVGGPPSPPTAVTATPGSGSLALSWTAPTNSNGAAVTGYTVTTSPSSTGCSTTGATSCTITGLTNNTAYSVTVTATNSFGTSAPSTAVSATPRAQVPGAPTGVTATVGDGTATVSWTAPAANGSAAVTGYTVTASPGGSCTTTGALTCLITGLNNATAYTVTVVATNAAGSGPASSPATSVPRFTCKVAALGANSYFTYPLAEGSGTSAADVSGNSRSGTYTSTGVTYGAAGPCPRDTPASQAVTLNGTTGAITGAQAVNNPLVLSVGIWFKTSVAGGKLIGLGNAQTGLSGQYDRHIYIGADGKAVFGVYVNGAKTISSATAYNNNVWHYAVGTLAPSTDANPGLRLYVDGALVASDTTTTTAETVGTAYWRIGGDNLGGWPNAGNNYFAGSLAFASTYTTALTPAQVLAQYHAGQ